MNNSFLPLFVAFLLTLGLTGCAVVGGIFKAGMIWGILLMVMLIVGIIYLVSRGGGKK